jgi:hypothetical protein
VSLHRETTRENAYISASSPSAQSLPCPLRSNRQYLPAVWDGRRTSNDLFSKRESNSFHILEGPSIVYKVDRDTLPTKSPSSTCVATLRQTSTKVKGRKGAHRYDVDKFQDQVDYPRPAVDRN